MLATAMASIQTSTLHPGTPEIALSAKWRLEAFGDVLDWSLEDEIKRLEDFVAGSGQQVALVASCDGVPAGTCLLAAKELEPCHSVSPWPAGLYVVPEFRRRGVGKVLVHATEEQARQRGHSQIYLYSDDAIAYYEGLGWRVVEHTTWHGFPMALLAQDLGA
jgi:GNAT superfamily N-acetyltransferase